MKRIPVPAWARPFERKIDDGFPEPGVIIAQDEAILAAVDAIVQRYVDDPELTFDHDLFPQRSRLTGEFYISSEFFWMVDEPSSEVGKGRQYRLSVFVRCLEHPRLADQIDTDYLGLEVYFVSHPETRRFEHQGDADSSSI